VPSSQKGNNQTWADSHHGRAAKRRQEDQAQACIEQADQRAYQRFACSPRAAGQGLSWFKRCNRLARMQASRIMLTLELWLLETFRVLFNTRFSAVAISRPFVLPHIAIVHRRPRQLRPNVNSGAEPDV
jgi:hypothetical protein